MNGVDWVPAPEPWKPAPPKLKTPPSDPTSQYPLSDVAAMPTTGLLSGVPPMEPLNAALP